MQTGRPKRPQGKPSAFQQIQDQLKWVDLIFEVRDARAPASSKHPRSDEIFGNKPRIIVLAKEDLGDPRSIKDWLICLPTETSAAIALSLKVSRGKEKLISLALKLTAAKREALAKRGLLPRPMRGCVVGMPNVGKSSFINWLIGQKKAMVGNKPGVTKGKQWVRLHPQLELLDTPGILPHTSFDQITTLKLSLLNLLPDNFYDNEDLAPAAMKLIDSIYPGTLGKYGINLAAPADGLEQLAAIRRCLGPGGRPDTRRSAAIFLTDVREGRLGRLTLDRPPAPPEPTLSAEKDPANAPPNS